MLFHKAALRVFWFWCRTYWLVLTCFMLFSSPRLYILMMSIDQTVMTWSQLLNFNPQLLQILLVIGSKCFFYFALICKIEAKSNFNSGRDLGFLFCSTCRNWVLSCIWGECRRYFDSSLDSTFYLKETMQVLEGGTIVEEGQPSYLHCTFVVWF